jgi:opacity protein-like surface antigen
MKKLLYGVAVMLFAAVPALAAIEAGNGELGVGVGSTQMDSDYANLDSGTSLAVRGGYFFKPAWELEGQLASTTADVSGTSDDATFRTYMVNGVYNFQTPKAIVPYVLAGVGMADAEFQNQSDNATAFQVGGGSRFFFGKEKRAALRVDISMIQQQFDTTTNDMNISAGFSWRLGK